MYLGMQVVLLYLIVEVILTSVVGFVLYLQRSIVGLLISFLAQGFTVFSPLVGCKLRHTAKLPFCLSNLHLPCCVVSKSR